MKIIQVDKSLSTDLIPEFTGIKTIEIEDKSLAEGAYGAVHLCLSVNGKILSTPQVVKLFKEDANNRQDHNFETIQKFQKKLRIENTALVQSIGKKITEKYPALKGVPQLSFEGKINGNEYRGFISVNLKKSGFEEFIDILNDTQLYKDYQQISVDKKMLIAFHLVAAFKQLQKMMFIHADFKPEAFFINTKTAECAIIDFDSGAITENPNDSPNVWGAPNDWVAPEIWEQLKVAKQTGLQKIKVNLFTDLWSVAVGIHYILTTAHPLFYLNELSPRVINEYFKKYKWPNVNDNEPYFHQGNKTIYSPIRNWLENTLPQAIFKELFNTINYGYTKPPNRTTYSQWEKVLNSVQVPPTIISFKVSTSKIFLGADAMLEWMVDNSSSTIISDGIGPVIKSGMVSISPPKSKSYKLTAQNAFGIIEKAVDIEVIPKPKIISFKPRQAKIPEGSSAFLVWEVVDAYKAQIEASGIVEDIQTKGEKVFSLKETTTFKLIITALDETTIFEESTLVHVFKKVKIISFTSDLNLVIETLPIKLSWQVENANQIFLHSNSEREIDVSGKTEIEVKPKRDTTFYLKAKNDLFDTTSGLVRITVQNLPTLPRLDNVIPSTKNLIPSFELSFKSVSDNLLEESQIEFSKAMSERKKFSLRNSLKSLVEKLR